MEKILIVDDETSVREVLAQKLSREGYECVTSPSTADALRKMAEDNFPLILSDIKMVGKDGIELLREVKEREPDTQVIMVTAVVDAQRAVEAMKLGAYDYVTKPFDLEDVAISVKRALEKRRLIIENRQYQQTLERKVREKTKELSKRNRQIQLLLFNVIKTLAYTLEAKDRYTEGHSRRVAENAALMAQHLGLAKKDVENIRLAGMLHDIGKIGIREVSLNKPDRLTAEEYDEVKRHPLIAEHILEPIEELDGIIDNIKHHHERYDGKGYPSRLKGETIPLGARILAVADCFDAMTSVRPYRPALSVREVLKQIEDGAGSQFDPEIVKIFLKICGEKEG